ncbi:MAG: endonuclease domain-containing protein [Draconibacterium sp.]
MTSTNSNHHYNRNLKPFARNLRNNSTLAEVILWDKILKRKQLRGYPFLRQRPVGNYIVDFFSKELKLIIELDGEIHKFQKSKDKKREEELIQFGFSIIRFDNEDILNGLPNVIRTLEIFIDKFESRISVITP